MKKLITLAVAITFSIMLFAADAMPVNEKVLQAFEGSFKDASEVVWHEYQNRYDVRFKNNEIDSRISYDKNGNVLKTVRYYSEAGLPLFIRAKLQEQYAGKKVFGVTECSAEGELDYYIVLEDATTWNHIKCDATGGMSVYKKYKKA